MCTHPFKMLVVLTFVGSIATTADAINQRGDRPWNTQMRSYYDNELGFRMWFLNLGPTGIRARIKPDAPDRFVVEHVFQDDQSPARGIVEEGDIIIGANNEPFETSHRFGPSSDKRGWDGPMTELAGHIEDSQGNDGLLTLMIHPKGDEDTIKSVELQLEAVGRFSSIYPYNCQRSEKLLEELCDFIVRDYESDNWKTANQFWGHVHGESHQLLALMASGIEEYEPIIEKYRKRFHNNTYSPRDGGFQTWRWGYDGIIMGEMYRLYDDEKLIRPMRELAKAQPWGSVDRNGMYAHRSHINIRRNERSPYASIAAISGLQMLSQSIFRQLGLYYEGDILETIYHHYLRSATPESLSVGYAFRQVDEGPLGRDRRHALIELKNPDEARSGKGPGYMVPNGMAEITEYEILWPHEDDHRWKPTDWVEDEREENTVEELVGNKRRVNRYIGEVPPPEDPTKSYETTESNKFLASIGLAAMAMTIGEPPREGWEFLGQHAADTCALGPGMIFDGHAESNLHSFWATLGAARTDNPEKYRDFLDYVKTFLIMSETHDGNGLILQPWGRDWADHGPNWGPRTLPTTTGIMLLSLPRRNLIITGAELEGREIAVEDQDVLTSFETDVAITLTGNDANDGFATYEIVKQPENGTLSGAPPELTYTPNAGFHGIDAFTFVVNDGLHNSAPAKVRAIVQDDPTKWNSIPFLDDFALSVPGDLHGQRGWEATNVIVQSKTVFDGMQAAHFEKSNSYMRYNVTNERTSVWIDMQLKAQPLLSQPDIPSNSTAVLFMNTNRQVMVYDGKSETESGLTVPSDTSWIRISMAMDYDAKEWSLYIDKEKVGTFGFYDDSANAHRATQIFGGNSTYIDEFGITMAPPAGLEQAKREILWQHALNGQMPKVEFRDGQLQYTHLRRQEDPSITYMLQTRTNLMMGEWEDAGLVAANTNSLNNTFEELSFELSAEEGKQLFIRLRLEEQE